MATINLLYIITFFSVLFIARFVFSRYYSVAEKYNLVKGYNNRAVHKGKVYTGAGLVLSFILLLVAVVLNNVEFLFFEKLAPIIEKEFKSHPGNTANFWLPTTRSGAEIWLNNFIKNKLNLFGDY